MLKRLFPGVYFRGTWVWLYVLGADLDWLIESLLFVQHVDRS
jgi:hypothetical protein